jgi:hypothetical protein
MSKIVVAMLAVGVFAAVGCEDKKPEAKPEPKPAAAPAAPAASAPAPAKAGDKPAAPGGGW